MNLQRFYRMCPYSRGAILVRSNFSTDNLSSICKYLNIDEDKGKYLQVKYPTIQKFDENRIKSLVKTLYDIGFTSDVILEEPSLWNVLPVTLKFRFTVLQECGINNITIQHLTSYLTIIKRKTIGELKKCRLIPENVNVENKLASCLSQWPTSLTTLVTGDVKKFTLCSLRIKIIQRYLELMLDLSEDDFIKGLKIYPTIKHRPLQVINETLRILHEEISMPHEKIRTNLYLVHADPENLRKIIHNFRSIGGINIKEVLRMYPKLAVKNYQTMMKTKQILDEYGVSPEAQTRCFELYTLSPETIKDRLEKAKSIPELNTFYNHPRFLKMIHYNNTTLRRITKLYRNNKKCLSLNVLSGSSAHYEVFERAPGDRLGKGKDLVYCISQALGEPFSISDVRNEIKRHPFWINIPIIRVKYVYEQLSIEFAPKDIYENCPILLYPWNKIRDLINMLNKVPPLIRQQCDVNDLSKSQKLSLILYLLEKQHYFTGNGVWTEEKQKSLVTQKQSTTIASSESNLISAFQQ